MQDESVENQLQKVEMTIDAARKQIALGEALERLQKNKDFKTLFTDHYLKEYATHLVMNQASWGMQDEAQQNFIKDQIIACGHLGQFLRFVMQEAAMAREAVRENQETRAAILQEENE